MFLLLTSNITRLGMIYTTFNILLGPFGHVWYEPTNLISISLFLGSLTPFQKSERYIYFFWKSCWLKNPAIWLVKKISKVKESISKGVRSTWFEMFLGLIPTYFQYFPGTLKPLHVNSTEFGQTQTHPAVHINLTCFPSWKSSSMPKN